MGGGVLCERWPLPLAARVKPRVLILYACITYGLFELVGWLVFLAGRALVLTYSRRRLLLLPPAPLRAGRRPSVEGRGSALSLSTVQYVVCLFVCTPCVPPPSCGPYTGGIQPPTTVDMPSTSVGSLLVLLRLYVRIVPSQLLQPVGRRSRRCRAVSSVVRDSLAVRAVLTVGLSSGSCWRRSHRCRAISTAWCRCVCRETACRRSVNSFSP